MNAFIFLSFSSNECFLVTFYCSLFFPFGKMPNVEMEKKANFERQTKTKKRKQLLHIAIVQKCIFYLIFECETLCTARLSNVPNKEKFRKNRQRLFGQPHFIVQNISYCLLFQVFSPFATQRCCLHYPIFFLVFYP